MTDNEQHPEDREAAPDAWAPPKAELGGPGLSFSQGVIVTAVIAIVGSGLYAVGGVAWATGLGVPFSIGLLASWLGKTRKVRLLILLGFCLIAPVAFLFAIPKEPAAGVFCGVIALVVLLPGYFLGYGAGAVIRRIDKDNIVIKRIGAPVTIGIPLAAHALQTLLALPIPPETITRELVIDQPAETVWQSSMFRGEAEPNPELPFKLGLTKPVAKSGDAEQVGDEKTYRFDDGELSIAVTESVPPSHLAFRVTAQRHVEDRAARFHGGVMRLQDLGDQTLVTFSMTYQPLMTPRWVLRPLEQWAGGAVLTLVLERMNGSAEIPMSRPVAQEISR